MWDRVECIREPERLNIPERLRHYWFEVSGRKVETLPGNPKVWKITYIKQLHKVAETAHLMTKEQTEALIRYQREIYMELKRSNARHVFAEWVRPEDLEVYKEWEFEEIKKAMANPNNMREMLVNYWWAILYVAEDYKTRTLHASEDYDIMVKSLDYLALHGCLSPTIMEERETHVAKLIADFLKENPGQNIFLVYGAWHTFHDNILSIYSWKDYPSQETIGFTNLARQLFLADEMAQKRKRWPGVVSKEKDREPPFGFSLPR